MCLPLLLDTGDSRSLLNVAIVQRLFLVRMPTAGAEDLYGYGHSKFGMVGTITFSVRYGTKALQSFTFQVSRHGANLVGLALFSDLGFSLLDNTASTILTVSSSWVQRWPSLFNGLGCLTAFDHQPLLNPEVRHSPPAPPTPCDDVTAELQKLLEAGIIEREDVSSWISILVVVRRTVPMH